MRIGDTIYLDHQAATPLDPRVLEAMLPYLHEDFGNPHSVDHVLGWTAARAVDEAATKVAFLLGADPDEIIFTSGATEANNLALLGLGRRATGSARRRILITPIEHKSVLGAAAALRDFFGYELELLPVDKYGFVILPELFERLRSDVLLVSIVLVNNEIGTIQDIAAIAPAVANVGAILHCDAAQAPCTGMLRDVYRGIDLISLSGHKMYGPKGIGVLFVRRDLQSAVEPLIYGGGQQRNLRSGTLPTPLCVGMGAAAELLCRADDERNRTEELRDRLVESLQSLEWTIELNGPRNSRHPGNANLAFDGFSSQDVLGALQPDLAASTGAACTSGTPEPSHVLRAIGLSDERAASSIRFSVGRHTTSQDVDDAVQLIARALVRLSDAGLRQTA